MSKHYVVYILECADGTLYTGMTNCLSRRLHQHQSGKGAKYTRSRLPVRLQYTETGFDRSGALKREYQLRRLTRTQKLALIQKQGGRKDEQTKK
jgi:putative endonuclease